MATQTVEFQCVTGQSVTAKLFAVGSDAEVASVSATEATNRKGIYRAAFTDVAAGAYDLIPFASTTPLARWQVVLTLTTSTFQAYEPIAISEIRSGLATATELAKVPKQGETRRYTQVAADSGNKTADVSIGAAL